MSRSVAFGILMQYARTFKMCSIRYGVSYRRDRVKRVTSEQYRVCCDTMEV